MLVDAQGFELVLPDGFVAGEGCDAVCCGRGGCGWLRVLECPVRTVCPGGPPGGPPPVRRTAYVWSCVRCIPEFGAPPESAPLIGVNTTFLWMGACWTVQDDPPLPVPPIGVLVRTSTDPVQCIPNCDDPRCPVGGIVYPAIPCRANGLNPTILVCGFQGNCGVFEVDIDRPDGSRAHLCYVVRRANGIPADQIPPGQRVYDLTGGTSVPSCCQCVPFENPQGAHCTIGQLWGGITDPPGGCFPDEELALTPCCCGLDNAGGDRGRLRVLNYSSDQVVGAPGGGPAIYHISHRVIAETINPQTLCAEYTGRQVYDDLRPGQQVHIETDYRINDFAEILLGCSGCGWSRMPWHIYPGGGFVQGVYGLDCVSGGFITVTHWELILRCDYYRNTATYVYFDPNSNQTITTTMVSEFRLMYAIADSDCNGGCQSTGNGLEGSPAGVGNPDGSVDGVEGWMDGVISAGAGGEIRRAKKRDAVVGGVVRSFRDLIRM